MSQCRFELADVKQLKLKAYCMGKGISVSECMRNLVDGILESEVSSPEEILPTEKRLPPGEILLNEEDMEEPIDVKKALDAFGPPEEIWQNGVVDLVDITCTKCGKDLSDMSGADRLQHSKICKGKK